MMDRRLKERLIGACLLVVLVVALVPEMLSGAPGTPRGNAPRGVPGTLRGGPPEGVRHVTVDLATSKSALPEAADTGGTAAATDAATPGGTAPTGPLSAGTGRSGSEGERSATPDIAVAHPLVTVPPPAQGQGQGPSPSPSQGSGFASSQSQGAASSQGLGPTSGQALGQTSGQAPGQTPGPALGQGAGVAVQLGSFAHVGNADRLARQLRAKGFSVFTSAEGAGTHARYRVRVGPFADRDTAERTVAKLKTLGHAATIVAVH